MRKGLNAKEVLTPMSGEKFIFPIADGTLKLSADGSCSTPLRDSLWYDGDARNDFWSISGNFITVITCNPESNCTRREESFPIPLKYIDVTRTADTSLDAMLEKNIDDNWNVDGDRGLSGTWTGFTRFTTLDEKPLDGNTWSGGVTRKQTTSRPDTVARDLERHVRCIETQRKAKVGFRKTEA